MIACAAPSAARTGLVNRAQRSDSQARAQVLASHIPAWKRAAAGAAAAALVLAAPAAPAAAANLALGEEVFTQNCAVCHAGGLNNIAGEEKHTLKKDAMDRYGFTTVEAISKQVNVGKDAMPPFQGVLSEEEIAAVSSYVLDKATRGAW